MTLYDILEGDSIETIIKQYGVNVLNVLGIVPQLVEENIITVSQAEEVAEAVEPVINSGVLLEEVNESSLSPVILEESFKEIEKSSPFENVQGLKAPNAKNSQIKKIQTRIVNLVKKYSTRLETYQSLTTSSNSDFLRYYLVYFGGLQVDLIEASNLLIDNISQSYRSTEIEKIIITAINEIDTILRAYEW